MVSHPSVYTTRLLFLLSMLPQEHDLELGVVDPNGCFFNTGRSAGLQGWYIYALSIFANITSDSGLTGKYVNSISISPIASPDIAYRLRTAVSNAAHSTDWTETDGILLGMLSTRHPALRTLTVS